MKVEKIVLNEAREVSLTAYLLDTGGEFRNICKRPAVLILPGGGYGRNALSQSRISGFYP